MGDLADEMVFAETSIGHVPITAPRGGIKYPARKETHMPNTPKAPIPVVRIEAALDLNLTLQQQLKDEEAKLREQLRKSDIPAPPPQEYTMFYAEVQFAEGGGIYEYLIHRNVGADHWCTTGSRPEHKRFKSWEALCAWLNSVHWAAPLSALQITEPRRFPTRFTAESPF